MTHVGFKIKRFQIRDGSVEIDFAIYGGEYKNVLEPSTEQGVIVNRFIRERILNQGQVRLAKGTGIRAVLRELWDRLKTRADAAGLNLITEQAVRP